MILVDLQNVCIANLMASLGRYTNSEIDVGMLRHMILNSLRANRMKFKSSHGELVICLDSRASWRREAFPYYKANRRQARENSDMNWQVVFEAFDQIKRELREVFPYHVLHVDGAEADDLIASVVMDYAESDTVDFFVKPPLILSGDKDFAQLQRYADVKQYDPVQKKYVVTADPEEFLFEHIIRGDPGDGVPNVLMSDDSMVMSERARPITKKRLNEFRNVEKMSLDVRRNYERNKLLIDLRNVPQRVREEVRAQMAVKPERDGRKIVNYMIENRLKMLLDNVQDF